MKPDIVYLNGAYLAADEAQISVFDRGFLFGDSVYEVIPFYRGVGFRLAEHLVRLRHSLASVRIALEADWEQILTSLVARNGNGNLSVYLQVSRGSAGRRSLVYDGSLQPTVFACCTPIPDIYATGADNVRGARVIVTADLRWRRCDIKATGLLPNILVRQQAQEAGADEALMIRDGLLTEGSSSNLFIVNNGVIYTPKLGSEILGGTTRDLVLALAREAGIPYQEVDLSYEQLLAADEVWISSSTRAVVPVLDVDGHPVGTGCKGPLWKRMFELFSHVQHRLMTGE